MLETLLALAVSAIINVQSIDIPNPMIEGYATAYCVSGTMASGQQTRPGVCAAKKEWLGKKAYIYQRLRKLYLMVLLLLYFGKIIQRQL